MAWQLLKRPVTTGLFCFSTHSNIKTDSDRNLSTLLIGLKIMIKRASRIGSNAQNKAADKICIKNLTAGKLNARAIITVGIAAILTVWKALQPLLS
jgi:hypothetical protein